MVVPLFSVKDVSVVQLRHIESQVIHFTGAGLNMPLVRGLSKRRDDHELVRTRSCSRRRPPPHSRMRTIWPQGWSFVMNICPAKNVSNFYAKYLSQAPRFLAIRLARNRASWNNALKDVQKLAQNDNTFVFKMLRVASQMLTKKVNNVLLSRLRSSHLAFSPSMLHLKYPELPGVNSQLVLMRSLKAWLKVYMVPRFGVLLKFSPLKAPTIKSRLCSTKLWCSRLSSGNFPCTCAWLRDTLDTEGRLDKFGHFVSSALHAVCESHE